VLAAGCTRAVANSIPLQTDPALQNVVSSGLCAGQGRYVFPGVAVFFAVAGSEFINATVAEVRCDDCDGEAARD
jgi:hypothetical protein